MPELRVTRGRPDDTELAALVVALAAVTAGGPSPAARPRRAWADLAGARPGRAGAWRRSGLPG